MTASPKELTDLPGRAASAAPIDLIKDVLAAVRLNGAIFLRAEYTAPWAYESPPASDLTRILQPGARRLILFHIIAEGGCWISIGRERVEAIAGDVIVLPYGEQHIMGSPEEAPPVPIASLLPAPPWQQLPVIRYGGGGGRTSVVCGYLDCDDPIFEPVTRGLPGLFSVRPPAGPKANWVAASIQYALDASAGSDPRQSDVQVRLAELVFLEVLRLYVLGNPQHSGWLAALRDSVVGPALAALHGQPARKWTLDELAGRASCSRSTLTERFTRLLSRAPMQYLGEWRLQLAAGLLRETTLGVAAVAYRVGYESEEAFSRAFKRKMGSPPVQWRSHVRAEQS